MGLVLRSHRTFVEPVVATFGRLEELKPRTYRPSATIVAGVRHPLTLAIKAVRCRKIEATTVAITTEPVVIRNLLQMATAVHLAYLILVEHLVRSLERQVRLQTQLRIQS